LRVESHAGETLGRWTVDGHPRSVEFAEPSWSGLLNAVMTEFLRQLWGGPEVGGVLFGRREPDCVRILAFRPLECEHVYGLAFELSENDECRLRDLLDRASTDEQLAGLEAVGWYHSRHKWLILSERSIRLYDRYFPEPWQIAMVFLRVRSQPSLLGLFFRREDGLIASSCREFSVREARSQAASPAPPSVPEADPRSEQSPGVMPKVEFIAPDAHDVPLKSEALIRLSSDLDQLRQLVDLTREEQRDILSRLTLAEGRLSEVVAGESVVLAEVNKVSEAQEDLRQQMDRQAVGAPSLQEASARAELVARELLERQEAMERRLDALASEAAESSEHGRCRDKALQALKKRVETESNELRGLRSDLQPSGDRLEGAKTTRGRREEPAGSSIEQKSPPAQNLVARLARRILRRFGQPRERRRARRCHNPALGAYYWTGGGYTLHEVVDISASGACLKTEVHWPPGTVVELMLQKMPGTDDRPADQHTSQKVLSKVVRSVAGGLGVKFIYQHAGEYRQVRKLLAAMGCKKH